LYNTLLQVGNTTAQYFFLKFPHGSRKYYTGFHHILLIKELDDFDIRPLAADKTVDQNQRVG
jgi:hypothetical protein